MQADTAFQAWPLLASGHRHLMACPDSPPGHDAGGPLAHAVAAGRIGGGAALAPVLLALARLPAFPRRGQVTKTFTKTCPLAPPLADQALAPAWRPTSTPGGPLVLVVATPAAHQREPPAFTVMSLLASCYSHEQVLVKVLVIPAFYHGGKARQGQAV